MQKLTEFYQKLEADIHHEVDNLKGGAAIKVAAYSCKIRMANLDLYKIINELVSIPTDGSVKNHQRCIQCIVEYINSSYSQCIIKYIPTNGKDNLIIGFNVEKLQNIQTGLMLCGHLDVVKGHPEQFAPAVNNNKIYGRGVADMKGAIACYLELIAHLNMPVILCLTCDEETNMQGIKAVCDFLEKRNIKPRLTLIGEPTDNKLGISSTGIESYKTTIYGISAHSSVPHRGINAIFIAARVLEQLEKISFEVQDKEVCLNVGIISGGEDMATIPDKTEISWGFRYTSAKNAQKVMELYDKAVVTVINQYQGAHIETTKTAEFLGYTASNLQETARLCERLNIKRTSFGYTTEAGYLAEIGHNVYLFGPGKIEQAHSDNEYINIDDLMNYLNILKELTGVPRTLSCSII